MQSNNRADANRKNAQHSTGPRTEEGKRRSSLNALRHGLTGQVIVMPGEDLAAYRTHCAAFHADLKPSGVLETHLTQTLADATWRLNRVRTLEQNLLSLGLNAKSDIIFTENPQVHAALATAAGLPLYHRELANLSIHESRISRQFDKTLAQLRQIQAGRKAEEAAQLEQAATTYAYHKSQGLPYDPQSDGFVFSIAQLDRHLRLRPRLNRTGKPKTAAA